MALMFEINAGKFPVNKKNIQLTVEKFADFFKIGNKYLSIAFVKDEEIKKMNKIYRGINKPTDVLSFGQIPLSRSLTSDGTQNPPLLKGEIKDEYAEIIISYPQAKKQAAAAGWKIGDEIKKLLIHALLHLIGYDHIKDKDFRKMEEMEERLLQNSPKLEFT